MTSVELTDLQDSASCSVIILKEESDVDNKAEASKTKPQL